MLFYANVQGKEKNISQLKDKNIMKKLEQSIKPVIYDTKSPDDQELANIKSFYNAHFFKGPELALRINSLHQDAEK